MNVYLGLWVEDQHSTGTARAPQHDVQHDVRRLRRLWWWPRYMSL